VRRAVVVMPRDERGRVPIYPPQADFVQHCMQPTALMMPERRG